MDKQLLVGCVPGGRAWGTVVHRIRIHPVPVPLLGRRCAICIAKPAATTLVIPMKTPQPVPQIAPGRHVGHVPPEFLVLPRPSITAWPVHSAMHKCAKCTVVGQWLTVHHLPVEQTVPTALRVQIVAAVGATTRAVPRIWDIAARLHRRVIIISHRMAIILLPVAVTLLLGITLLPVVATLLLGITLHRVATNLQAAIPIPPLR